MLTVLFHSLWVLVWSERLPGLPSGSVKVWHVDPILHLSSFYPITLIWIGPVNTLKIRTKASVFQQIWFMGSRIIWGFQKLGVLTSLGNIRSSVLCCMNVINYHKVSFQITVGYMVQTEVISVIWLDNHPRRKGKVKCILEVFRFSIKWSNY